MPVRRSSSTSEAPGAKAASSTRPTVPVGAGRIGFSPDRLERESLGRALDGVLDRGPDPADVQLVIKDARLERGRFLGEEGVVGGGPGGANVRVEAQHLELILGLALEVLLAAGVADER